MDDRYLEYTAGFEDSFSKIKNEAFKRQLFASVEAVLKTIKRKKLILLCGNGGSASDASHIAAELVCRFEKNRAPLRAISLTTDNSLITAIGNDFGYKYVFSRQVEALGEEDGLLWLLSTSGKSENIRLAIEKARNIGMKTFLMTGKQAPIQDLCDFVINVPSIRTAYIQEIHRILYHFICLEVENTLSMS